MFKNFVRDGELRRWAPWAGAVALMLLAIVLETSMESVCWDEEAAKAAKINESAGCFEFWFNRYQAFIGAIVALGAAAIAVIPARGQLRQMYRQTAVSARQPMVDLAKDLEQEIIFLDNFNDVRYQTRRLLEFYDDRDLQDIYPVFGEQMRESRNFIDAELRSLRNIKARHPFGSGAFDARATFFDASIELEGALNDFDAAFRTDVGAIDVEDGEYELSPIEIRSARLRIGAARINWIAAMDELRQQLSEELESAWSRIRILEARALNA
ncbi:hypothetical protein MKK84_32785 [Methylobacterium sp. E-065]|uniref:hypothetical protein n=1 Tax=Methylobacterium sp. E-065 TaxID=2836583 RepID=UPI001FBAF722|nr:hypothetical protein [Methylobacterium sp. E-065]MCJ2022125.1 hypothetical protein [Methylobacterium sp. E-065]